MAKNRKGWDSLSPAYRRRLTNQGISKTAYSTGVSIRAARGHLRVDQDTGETLITPESARYRKLAAQARVDIRSQLPDFDELPRAEQERLARLWVVGITSKAKGPATGKRGRRKPTAAQVRAKMDFLDYFEETTGDSEATYWRQYRKDYDPSYTANTAA